MKIFEVDAFIHRVKMKFIILFFFSMITDSKSLLLCCRKLSNLGHLARRCHLRNLREKPKIAEFWHFRRHVSKESPSFLHVDQVLVEIGVLDGEGDGNWDLRSERGGYRWRWETKLRSYRRSRLRILD